MTQPEDQKRQAEIETIGTATWLLMDVLWMFGAVEAGAVAGVVTLGLQVGVFRYLPRTRADWSANAAVACWVVMNLFWMLGDAYERRVFFHIATLSVAASFLLLGWAVWEGGWRGPVVERFRRFRFRRLGT
jgi:hypothetical protein